MRLISPKPLKIHILVWLILGFGFFQEFYFVGHRIQFCWKG